MFDSQSVSKAREIVERYRTQATKERNRFNKIRRGWFPCAGLPDPEARVPADTMYLIHYEVENVLKDVGLAISNELQPTESLSKIKEYANNEQQLDALMQKEFKEIYDEGKKAKLNSAELAIFVLGKVIESK